MRATKRDRSRLADKDTPDSTPSKKLRQNASNASPNKLTTSDVSLKDPAVAFGRVPIVDKKLSAALMTYLNGVPVHAFVSKEAAKLFSVVKVTFLQFRTHLLDRIWTIFELPLPSFGLVSQQTSVDVPLTFDMPFSCSSSAKARVKVLSTRRKNSRMSSTDSTLLLCIYGSSI